MLRFGKGFLENGINNPRLYNIGETFYIDGMQYKVSTMSIAENTQHVNLEFLEEDVNILIPHL